MCLFSFITLRSFFNFYEILLMTKSTTELLTPLLEYLQLFSPISQGFIDEHVSYCTFTTIKKSKFILSPIDQNESFYFLVKGFVRGFIRERGKDITTWFSSENDIVGAIKHPERPKSHSVEYLQALEDCDLIVIPYKLLESIYGKYKEGQIIGRKLIALKYYAASQRAILARIPNATDRFKRLVESGTVDLNRVPMRYLSSYLGIRIETLSRIRGKKE